ncbi:hypothetical protein AB35_3642 [Escherichia coli 2-474-04_S1_C2]|nr:hypothetical protein AB35_3642 [Escherichia coli 2-474-04_S1_C2]
MLIQKLFNYTFDVMEGLYCLSGKIKIQFLHLHKIFIILLPSFSI